MGLKGAIIGDIIGSQYEFIRCGDPYNCSLITDECKYTDDTVMSIATKYAIDNQIDFQQSYRTFGRLFNNAGYGGMFKKWLNSPSATPYFSFGNGSAMRCSYIGEHYSELNKVQEVAAMSAICTHNHPEGVKGAIVTASCIWYAKNGYSKEDIYNYVLSEYPSTKYQYSIDKDFKYLQNHYEWNCICQDSVPVAIKCFIESNSYEEFIRNVLSLDCDADTLCAIGGSIAEEFYKESILNSEDILSSYLDSILLSIYHNEKIIISDNLMRFQKKNE